MADIHCCLIAILLVNTLAAEAWSLSSIRSGTRSRSSGFFEPLTFIAQKKQARQSFLFHTNQDLPIETLDDSTENTKGWKLRSRIRLATRMLKAKIRSLRLGVVQNLPTILATTIGAFALGYSLRRPRRNSHYTTGVPLLRFLVFILMGREIWRMTPVWLRQQIVRKATRSGDSSLVVESFLNKEEDWTSLATLGTKLSTLMSSISDKMADDQEENDSKQPGDANMFASLTAIWNMNQHLRERGARDRDDSYRTAGTLVDNPASVMAGLDVMFEFADWAYDEIANQVSLRDALARVNYNLLRHDKEVLPGAVAHYVALSRERKLAIVGVKGTSSFEDLLTDMCGQAVSCELEGSFVTNMEGPTTTIQCHEGIFAAAKRLADDLDVLIMELLVPTGYRIVLTGHSLGAGVAAICSLILRGRHGILKEISIDSESLPESGRNHVEKGADADISMKPERLSAIAFACPPCLDYDAALACSSFLTTVVNNSDVIPRSSLSNLVITRALMREALRELNEARSADSNVGADSSLSPKELRNALSKIQDGMDLRDSDALYCPGRVLQMFDHWDSVANSREIGNSKTSEQVVVTDGASKVLRFIEIDPRMMGDHMAPSYRSSIRSLICPETQ